MPQASIAVHVRVITNGHAYEVVSSSIVGVISPSHKSLALGVLHTGTLGHSIVVSAPTPLNTGGVVSGFTVKVASQLSVVPQ